MKDRVKVPDGRRAAGRLTEVGTSRLAGRSFGSGCCFPATFISHSALFCHFLRSFTQRLAAATTLAGGRARHAAGWWWWKRTRNQGWTVSSGAGSREQGAGTADPRLSLPPRRSFGLAARQRRVCPPLKRSCVKAQDG